MSGNTVVAGAFNDDDNGSNSGSAYIFYWDQGGADNWGEVKKIIGSDGGWVIALAIPSAINGDTVVVGAYSDYEISHL